MLKAIFGSHGFSYSEVQQAIDDGSFDIESFLTDISATQLLIVETEGPNKGRTLLWLLALYASTQPTFFLRAWEKFNEEINLKDILVIAESGNEKGRSLLWLLLAAIALNPNATQPFIVVWDKFFPELTLEHLRSKAQAGEAIGISVLWMLGFMGSSVDKQIFLRMWGRFGHNLTLADLRDAPQVGYGIGLNFLWFLANLASNGYPEFFDSVWEKHKDDLNVRDFQSVALFGKFKGSSTLWLLVKAANRYQPKTFLSVWRTLKKHFTYDDFAVCVELTSGKTFTVIDLLRFLKEVGDHIVYEIVTQMSGLPNDRVMQSLRKIVTPEFYADAQNIFAKKRELYTMLTRLNRKKTLNIAFQENDLVSLFELGEAALTAGYVNAFYEIFELLKNTGSEKAAAEAREKLSINSWHDEVPPETRAQQFYNAALAGARNAEYRERNLLAALCFALKVTGGKRVELIQAIGYCYITGRNDYNPATPYLSQDFLSASCNGGDFDFIVLSERLDLLKKQYVSQQQAGKPAIDALAEGIRTRLTFSPASNQIPASRAYKEESPLLPPPPTPKRQP